MMNGKCIIHRAAAEWRSQFPTGKPTGVIQWEDDARFFLRFAARELRANGHEIASDYLLREVAMKCDDGEGDD